MGSSQVADPIGDVAQTVAAEFGISRWTKNTAEIFCDPDIDAVVICSPTAQRAEQIIEAARHKKQIFCEKPVAFSLDVVNEAIKAVRSGCQ